MKRLLLAALIAASLIAAPGGQSLPATNVTVNSDGTVTRGGGGALYKPGKQLNDYHPVCIATEGP